jgi:5,10-methylenetetrahydrofolate reductase
MCDLCYGTHVVHEIDSFSIGFATCPECGPEPEEQFQARMDELQKRIEQAEMDFERKGA